jgi:hypothetical protein
VLAAESVVDLSAFPGDYTALLWLLALITGSAASIARKRV